MSDSSATNNPNNPNNQKRAFLVVGAESSGTKFLTSLLIAGGCHGSSEHLQPFDSEEFGGLSPIVWRRSVPHNTDWGAWARAVETLGEDGYFVTILISVRNSTPCALSQKELGLAETELSARRNIAYAYHAIFQDVVMWADWELWRIVTYESLRSIEERKWILKELGLDEAAAEKVEFVDGNRRRWEGSGLVGGEPR